MSHDRNMDTIKAKLAQARSVTVLTGAGISADSGEHDQIGYWKLTRVRRRNGMDGESPGGAPDRQAMLADGLQGARTQQEADSRVSLGQMGSKETPHRPCAHDQNVLDRNHTKGVACRTIAWSPWSLQVAPGLQPDE